MSKKPSRSLVLLAPVVGVALVMFALAVADDQPPVDSATNPSPTLSQMPPSANDSIFTLINAGFENIKPALVRSCYDCHSDQTHYPWYAKLPFVKGMIERDIKNGRRKVDFSNGFPFAGKGSQAEMLTDIRNEIAEGEMPIMAYRFMHWGRLIEPPLQDTVFAWIDSSLARLATAGIVAPKSESGGEEREGD